MVFAATRSSEGPALVWRDLEELQHLSSTNQETRSWRREGLQDHSVRQPKGGSPREAQGHQPQREQAVMMTLV